MPASTVIVMNMDALIIVGIGLTLGLIFGLLAGFLIGSRR